MPLAIISPCDALAEDGEGRRRLAVLMNEPTRPSEVCSVEVSVLGPGRCWATARLDLFGHRRAWRSNWRKCPIREAPVTLEVAIRTAPSTASDHECRYLETRADLHCIAPAPSPITSASASAVASSTGSRVVQTGGLLVEPLALASRRRSKTASHFRPR